MTSEKKRIGLLLVERGVIDKHQLQAALQRQKLWQKKLVETLVDMNFITEQTVMNILSEHFKLPAIDADQFPAEKAAINLVDGDFCTTHSLVPLAIRNIKGQSRLVIAVADPSNVIAIDELRFKVNMPLAIAVSGLSSVSRAIQKHYYGVKSTFREGITVTTTMRPEDAVMEVIQRGDQSKLHLENVYDPMRSIVKTEMEASSKEVLKRLVQILERKSILTSKESHILLELLNANPPS